MSFIKNVFNRPTTTGGTQIMIIAAIMAVLGLVLEIVAPDLLDTAILVTIETLLGIIFTFGASRNKAPNEKQAMSFAGTKNPDQERPKKGD